MACCRARGCSSRIPDVINGLYFGSLVAIVAQLVFGILHAARLRLAGQPAAAVPCGLIMALILSGVYTLDHSLFDLGFVLAMRAPRLSDAALRLPVPAD